MCKQCCKNSNSRQIRFRKIYEKGRLAMVQPDALIPGVFFIFIIMIAICIAVSPAPNWVGVQEVVENIDTLKKRVKELEDAAVDRGERMPVIGKRKHKQGRS